MFLVTLYASYLHLQVGGQVRFHGLPGPSVMPVWVKLSKDAGIGNKTITVDSDLKGMWPIGAQIVVTSSDYDKSQSETFSIVAGCFTVLNVRFFSLNSVPVSFY